MAKKQFSVRPLVAGQFYRAFELPAYYGCGLTKIDEMIKAGEIEPLVPVSPGGRARGQFGETIITWQKRRKEAAPLRPLKGDGEKAA